MQIKCLERFIHGRDIYERGDIRTVAEDQGTYFVTNGWAEDTEGKIPTGDRDKAHGKILEVQDGLIVTKLDFKDGKVTVEGRVE